ncbi:MAG: hypothetical protein K2X03_08205 [Bryobacteraceae bacterium]|nr:hypothetical protein [Bryobacteraceae bacterium]
MKTISLILCGVFTCGAQSGAKLATGEVSSHGIFVRFETRLEPDSPPIRRFGGGVLTENEVIKRHLGNFDNHTYFGYDLTMEALPDGRARLRFAGLTMTPAKMSEIFKNTPQWTALPLPAAPAMLDVRVGETVALDLFVNPSTGQKVTEYLTIASSARTEARVEGTARDFAAEDVDIAISSPKVSIDGKPAFSWRGAIAGQAVWLDLPAHGRFVFSLLPRPDLGMQKLGEIRGSLMTWRSGGHDYSLTASKPIAPGSRAYHLFVFPIPRAVTEFTMWAGPKPDDPIRHR